MTKLYHIGAAHNHDEVYAKIAELLNKVYPVGAIYMSVSSTNPGTLFGGTWTAWGSGKVPVGINASDSDFDTVEETGGAKTHSHGLSSGYAKVLPSTDGWIGFSRIAVPTWSLTHKNNASNNST